MSAPPTHSARVWPWSAAWVVLFAAACIVRFPRIARVGNFEGGGDEWFTAWRSLQVLFERGNPGNFLHPALFYDAGAAMYAAVYALGRARGHYADGADLLAAFALHERVFLQQLQYLSAVFGALTVPVVFELGRRAFSLRTGVIAALILLVLPLHVEYSQRIRVDSLATLLVALAGLALVALDRRQRAREYVLAGASVGLATAANYPGLLLFAPFALVHFRHTRALGSRDDRVAGHRLFALALASALAAFILANPFSVLHPSAFAQGFAFQFSMAYRTHPHGDDLGPGLYLRVVLEQGIPFAVAGALALVWAIVRERGVARDMAAFVVLYLVAFAVLRTQGDRYILPALPWWCVLTAAMLDGLVRMIPRARSRWGDAFVWLVAFALGADIASHSFPVAFSTPNTNETGRADREVLQDRLLTSVPHGASLWLEADVLPLVQAAFADPGGALAREAREGVRRAYHGFDARVLKGQSVERIGNYEPEIIAAHRVDFALTCDRSVREAQRDEPGAAQRRAFYQTLFASSSPVFAGTMGCTLYRVR